MKKLIFTLSMLLLSVVASAQYTKSIHLWAEDDTDVMFALSRALTIRFDNGQLTASDGTQSLTINLDKVKIEYSTEDVTSIDAPQLQQVPSLENGAIVFRGMKAGQQVRVYSIDGKLLMKIPIEKDAGLARLVLSTLPKGISIIQAGKYNMKYRRP